MESRATTLMRAYCEESFDQVLAAIRLREREPFKSPSLELGIDIDKIRRACVIARRRAIVRDLVLVALYLVTLVVVVSALNGQMPEANLETMAPASGWPIGTLLVLYGGMVATCLAVSWIGRRRARNAMQQMTAPLEELLDPLPTDQTEVAVSGGYSPFAGAGTEVMSWSFTIDLTEAADASQAVRPFNVEALHQEIESRFVRLFRQPSVVRDLLFVDGRDVQTVEPLMPAGAFACPARFIQTAEIPNLAHGRERLLRPYKCMRTFMWGGQLPVSTFYRFCRSGEVLFCESRIFVMPPLREEFRKAERLPLQMNFPEGARLFGLALLEPIWRWAAIGIEVSNWLSAGWIDTIGGAKRWQRHNRKQVQADRHYNYGWPTSLRQEWSANGTYERYFQQVDQDFQVKMVKEALLSSLLSSLEQCNINTDDFKTASSRIINEGIIISGGSVHAESMTAGRRARSTFNKTGKGAREARAA